MPKVKWGVTGSDVDNIEPDEEFEQYDGPVPPAGVYWLTLKKATYKKFSTGSKGIETLWLIDDDRRDKKQYNGCPVWENIIDLDTTAFKIRQFLDAIGAEGRDWDNVLIDKDNVVQKIGRFKTEGLKIRATLKRGKNQSDEPRPEIQRMLRPTNANEDADDNDGDDDGEAPF